MPTTILLCTVSFGTRHNLNIVLHPPLAHNNMYVYLCRILLIDIQIEVSCLHSFRDSLTHSCTLRCLSVWQRKRGQPRVFDRGYGSFWLQRVWLRTQVQALGFTPTDSSCKRRGPTRRRRRKLYLCNSGPRRSVPLQKKKGILCVHGMNLSMHESPFRD